MATAYGGGRRGIGPLLVVKAVVYLILLGLAGWSLNKYIDGNHNHPLILGYAHLRIWNNLTLATATTSAMFSWALTALAFGLVCKQISMGGHRGRRLQTLEAFIAISGVTELLYLLLLHAGMFSTTAYEL